LNTNVLKNAAERPVLGVNRPRYWTHNSARCVYNYPHWAW
jgi:hypothetical protein